jgi:hypothetical protein
VKHAVAVGQTGHGKSALATHFCYLYRNSFEFFCWIDCRDPSFEATIRRITKELTGSAPPQSDPSARFREALASHRGPWLIVFDGATARGDIEKCSPTMGNGCVVITTTNETGWWPSAQVIPVGTFTDEEAGTSSRAMRDLTRQRRAVVQSDTSPPDWARFLSRSAWQVCTSAMQPERWRSFRPTTSPSWML